MNSWFVDMASRAQPSSGSRYFFSGIACKSASRALDTATAYLPLSSCKLTISSWPSALETCVRCPFTLNPELDRAPCPQKPLDFS